MKCRYSLDSTRQGKGYEAWRRLRHAYDPRLSGRCAGMLLAIKSHVLPEGEQLRRAMKCMGIRESQGRSLAQELTDSRAREALAEARCNPGRLSQCQDEVINCSFATAAARGLVLVGVDQVNVVKGKGKIGEGKDSKGKKGNGKVTGQGGERRCFHCEEKGHIKSNCRQKVIDDKKSDSKGSSSTGNVMLVTGVATARENDSSVELWISAIAVGGSLGSGNGAPGEIAELMVDSGAALAT